jgi:membrane protein implicated in regulation of membrane protease activity
MLEENISEITGYRNHIEVDGKIVKLESKNPLTVGSRVEVVRRVNYSLR